ncbi:MAG: hypothetical protein ACC656_02915 [Candidatus Heimdallarchaeota archaeon]
MTQQKINSSIGYLLEKLQNQDPNLEQSLDMLLSKIFGLLLTFLSNELTPQQRQIWLSLAEHYPDPKSGSELATIIGSSKSSKTIYKSIEVLKRKELIVVHHPHPRTFSIQANPKHPLTEILVDFCSYYGKKGES